MKNTDQAANLKFLIEDCKSIADALDSIPFEFRGGDVNYHLDELRILLSERNFRSNRYISKLKYVVTWLSSFLSHDECALGVGETGNPYGFPEIDGDIATITRKIGKTLSSFSDEAYNLYPDSEEIAELRREVFSIAPEPGKLHKAVDLFNKFSKTILKLKQEKVDSDRKHLNVLSNDFDGLSKSVSQMMVSNERGGSSVQKFNSEVIGSLHTIIDNGFVSGDINVAKKSVEKIVNDLESDVGRFVGEQSAVISEQATLIERQKNDLEHMKEHVAELRKKLDETSEMIFVDQLTGLNNRRGYEDQCMKAYFSWKTKKQDLGLLIVDCDHFKKVNDGYGHATGDNVLRYIASILKKLKSVFPSVHISRYGGEEFVILLPGVVPTKVVGAAQLVKKAVEKNPYISDDGSVSINLTVSIGVSFLIEKEDTMEFIFDGADKCLYHAKQSGRNKVFVHRKNLID